MKQGGAAATGLLGLLAFLYLPSSWEMGKEKERGKRKGERRRGGRLPLLAQNIRVVFNSFMRPPFQMMNDGEVPYQVPS